MSSALPRLLAAFPFKTSVVLGLLCFVIVESEPFSLRLSFAEEDIKKAEFYPLSSFPMYSKFSANPCYLYLTDTDDKPIPCETELGVRASVIKKIYDYEVRIVGKREDHSISKLPQPLKEEAGLATLSKLRNEVLREQLAVSDPGPMRLYEVIIRRGEDGRINETTTFVGEL